MYHVPMNAGSSLQLTMVRVLHLSMQFVITSQSISFYILLDNEAMCFWLMTSRVYEAIHPNGSMVLFRSANLALQSEKLYVEQS